MPIEWVSRDTIDALHYDYIPSLQIAPKTGTGGNRKGIPYKDISAGKHDTLIIEGFEQIKAELPVTGPRAPFEVHSEFNVQTSGAQPPTGPAEDYAAFCNHVHDLAVDVGVRNRLNFIASATRGIWDGKEWHRWLDGCIDNLDTVAVDGYSQPVSGNAKEFEAIVHSVITVAGETDKDWAVMETGCQEMRDDDQYKAGWFRRAGDFILAYTSTKDLPRMRYVIFNTTDDGPGGWYPTTSTQAERAFTDLCNRPIWKA